MLLLSLLRGRFRQEPLFLTSLLTFLLLVLLPGPAQPISFQLPGKARKCLREEIHRDKLVTGEYEVAPPPGSSSGPSANLKVQERGAQVCGLKLAAVTMPGRLQVHALKVTKHYEIHCLK
uniref:Uncharacterized protein n=1 Tax=Laticauda laticaudata TaxID=8630 RepID=A0A8C5WSA3_LATLA